MAQQNLYQYKDYFQLITAPAGPSIVVPGQPPTENAMVEYTIDEPIGFDKVRITLEEDPEYYALNYEFIADTIVLEFVENQGFEIIRSQYELYGSDIKILFRYGNVSKNGVNTVQFEGTLNMNYYHRTPRGCTATIEKQNFENLFRTRVDTKVTLSAILTQDDLSMQPAQPVYTKLHSKVLEKQSRFIIPDAALQTFEWDNIDFIPKWYDGPTLMFVTLDTVNEVSTEIQEIPSYIMGVQYAEPMETSLYNFKALEDGVTTFKIHTKCRFNIDSQGFPTGNSNPFQYRLRQILYWFRGGVHIDTLFGPVHYHDKVPGQWLINPVFDYDSGEFSYECDIIKGDEIYLLLMVTGQADSGVPVVFQHMIVDNYKNDVFVSQFSLAPATYCLQYTWLEAMNKIIESITGRANAVISTFLSEGCGKDWTLTNGFQCRNFEVDKRPVQLSFTDLFEGISKIFNLGYGFRTVNDLEYLVIEPMDYFYSGQGIIATFKDVYKFAEDHFKDVVYNKVIIGYENYSEEKLNTLDDFSTYHEYALPIKTYKATKEIKSELIASGYLIEDQRRALFKDTPTTSYPNDDAIFIFNVIQDNRVYSSVGFNTDPTGPSIVFSKNIMLDNGSTFTITGANNGTVFTVMNRITGGYNGYVINPAPVTDNGLTTISIPIVPPAPIIGIPVIPADAILYECAKDEDFATITGLISPETAYNLKASPQRMMYNWATYFNIGLTRKRYFDTIKNTYTRQNKDLTTLLNTGVACGMPGTITEGNDIVLGNYLYELRPYIPMIATWSAKVSFDTIVKIRQAMRGEIIGLTSQNYGCIVYYDDYDVPWLAKIKKMEYDPYMEEAAFTVYKIHTL